MADKKIVDMSPLTFPSDLTFIKKASAKVAAMAFMLRAEGFIRASYPLAIPVLNDALAGKNMPSPSLERIKAIAFEHYNQEQLRKADKSLERDKARANGTTGSGRYSVQYFVSQTDERTEKQTTVLFQDKDGNTTFLMGTYGECERTVDRKQNENPQALYAVIKNTEGVEIQTTIMRQDSIYRINRKRASIVCQPKTSGESKPFKNYCTGSQTRVSFSRG